MLKLAVQHLSAVCVPCVLPERRTKPRLVCKLDLLHMPEVSFLLAMLITAMISDC